MAIDSHPTDRAQVQRQTTARREARTVAADAKAAAAAEGPSKEELQAEAADRTAKCTTYKARMQKLVTSRRVYRQDEAGERVYLDEAQTIAAREMVENQISEYCGS